MDKSLNANGQSLTQLLAHAQQQLQAKNTQHIHAQKVHIVGAGGAVTAAYEQLRNAAEYAEEHTLLQRAIRRFYRRLFLVRDERQIRDSGEELAIELTLAGYIENDTVTEHTVSVISKLAASHYAAYIALNKDHAIAREQVETWTIEVLAVRIDWELNNPALAGAYVQFVYDYYQSSPKISSLFTTKPDDFDLALYIALHRALLKSDLAVVRTGLLSRYQQTPDGLDSFIATNQKIDSLFKSSTVERLYRYIDRHGAPLRVLRHVIDEQNDVATKLTKPNEFLSLCEAQILTDYQSINTRINRGILKSVAFLIITKVLIGLAIEVPYDYFMFGAIAAVPLIINLGFPPLYMILLRMTLMLPGSANTRRLIEEIDEIVYGSDAPQLRRASRSFGASFNIVYAIAFMIVFGGSAFLLWHFAGFDLLHLSIFFLFLSGASFLGFRLSRMIREIEAVDSEQNGVTTVRDFLYMPFVIVGRFMSDKYSKVNIVALALDMLIELPLKTILRLIRQWAAFISSKKDEL